MRSDKQPVKEREREMRKREQTGKRNVLQPSLRVTACHTCIPLRACVCVCACLPVLSLSALSHSLSSAHSYSHTHTHTHAKVARCLGLSQALRRRRKVLSVRIRAHTQLALKNRMKTAAAGSGWAAIFILNVRCSSRGKKAIAR